MFEKEKWWVDPECPHGKQQKRQCDQRPAPGTRPARQKVAKTNDETEL